MRTKISLNLRGGLGNQLFGVYAAIEIRKLIQEEVEIQLSGVDYSHSFSNSDIRALEIDKSLNFVEDRSFGERATWALQKKKYPAPSFIKDRISVLTINGDTLGMTEIARNVQLRKDQVRYLVLEGYFQDFSNYEKNRKLLDPPKLKNPSRWYFEMQEKILSEKPIIVHMRLGDYLVNSIGTLAAKYYKQALDKLKSEINSENVLVCSDSPDIASIYIKNWSDTKVELLEVGSEPSETLFLMSQHNGLICSNSTFSLWAGALSTSQKSVYVPRDFSRSRSHEIKNLPKDWTRIDSEWD